MAHISSVTKTNFLKDVQVRCFLEQIQKQVPYILSIDENVAIKVVYLNRLRSSLMKSLLKNEIDAMKHLNCSNYVVKCH